MNSGEPVNLKTGNRQHIHTEPLTKLLQILERSTSRFLTIESLIGGQWELYKVGSLIYVRRSGGSYLLKQKFKQKDPYRGLILME